VGQTLVVIRASPVAVAAGPVWEEDVYKLPGTGVVIGAGTAQGLAVTGVNYAWWIAFGMLFVVVGVFLVHAAQRKNRHSDTADGDRA
jgi:hypothetical protein